MGRGFVNLYPPAETARACPSAAAGASSAAARAFVAGTPEWCYAWFCKGRSPKEGRVNIPSDLTGQRTPVCDQISEMVYLLYIRSVFPTTSFLR